MRVVSWCFALVYATAVLLLLLLTTDTVVGTAATVAAAKTPAPVAAVANESTDATAPTAASSATAPAGSSATGTAASPVPIHSAQANSDTFRVTDNLVCPDIVAARINAVYLKNKKLFTSCMEKSGYQIFPYSGKVPTANDITLMVQTPECMAVITAVALSDFPACSIGDMPVKAVVETLLKISVDMANGAKAPSASEFHALMAWRRDVNAAQSAGVPYDSGSELYSIFKKALWKAMTTTTVKVLSDLTIIYAGSSQSAATSSAVVGTVKPSNATSSGSASSAANVKSVSAPSASTSQSAGVRPVTVSSVLVGVTTLAALLAWTP